MADFVVGEALMVGRLESNDILFSVNDLNKMVKLAAEGVESEGLDVTKMGIFMGLAGVTGAAVGGLFDWLLEISSVAPGVSISLQNFGIAMQELGLTIGPIFTPLLMNIAENINLLAGVIKTPIDIIVSWGNNNIFVEFFDSFLFGLSIAMITGNVKLGVLAGAFDFTMSVINNMPILTDIEKFVLLSTIGGFVGLVLGGWIGGLVGALLGAVAATLIIFGEHTSGVGSGYGAGGGGGGAGGEINAVVSGGYYGRGVIDLPPFTSPYNSASVSGPNEANDGNLLNILTDIQFNPSDVNSMVITE